MTERLHANRTRWFPPSAWWVGLQGGRSGGESPADRRPAPHASHNFAVLAPTPRTGLPYATALNPIFEVFVGKNDLHIRVFTAFPGAGWVKQGGENGLDSRATNGHWARSKSAVFWQTERYSGVFSTRTENSDFSGVSVWGLDMKTGKEAQFGRIFPHSNYTSF